MKKRKRFMSLGLLTALMLGISSEGIQAYAMTNQSITAESGYRLYADSLTSTSGIIKGDVTELLPDYEISSVILPDGSTASADEVSYSITGSGDYSFEVIYEIIPEDKQAKVNLNLPTLPTQQSTEKESITTVTKIEENVDVENTSETQTEAKSIDEVAKEVQEVKKSEKLTLTVTLPVAEEKVQSTVEQKKSHSEEVGQDVPEETQSAINSITAGSESIETHSDISTYAMDGAGWDTEYDFYGSRLNWTRERFNTYTTYWGSTAGMNYSGNNQSLNTNGYTTNYRTTSNGYALATNSSTPTFRWGYYNLHYSTYNWIQYSQGFSDITVNLRKDFALGGTMKIGNDFGYLDSSSEGAVDGYAGIGANNGLRADGGLTISLLPANQRDIIIKNSGNGLSAVQRLGAYGAFRNAIVMEYDVGHQNGYSSITGNNGSSFSVLNPNNELQRVGDYKMDISDLQGLGFGSGTNTNFYEKYYSPNVASNPHIGISVTGSDGYVNSSSNSSTRRFIFGRGNLDNNNYNFYNYKIEYKVATGEMFFGLRRANTGTWDYTVRYTLPESYRNKDYLVATSFSAIYQHHTRFSAAGTSGFFNGATDANTSDIGRGQMELTIQGVYSQPNLDNLTNQVVFMSDNQGSLNEGITSIKAYKNGYVDGSDSEINKKNKRKYFPLEGDKIIIQNQADISALFNETAMTNGDITLTNLSFRDLQFVDSNGTSIDVPSALDVSSIGAINISYYYSVNGGADWIPCSKSNSPNRIISNGNEPLRWRIVIQLPNTLDVTDYTNKQFWFKGETVISVSRGGSTASFNLPWVKENSNRVTFFSDPKDVRANNIDTNTARVISSNGTNVLYGNKTSDNIDAVSYGLKVWYSSEQAEVNYIPSDQQTQSYEYKTFDQILSNNGNATSGGNVNNSSITLQNKARYIVTYSLYDSAFNDESKLTTYTGNQDRSKASTKRVIWKSDNVLVQSGYEFYLEPKVELSLEDFEGFSNSNNKAEFYRKIADAANVSVFKTADANWTNLARTGTAVATTISGDGNDHQKIINLMNKPGTTDNITIRFQNNGMTIDKTVKVTFLSELPKVVSNVDDNSITNETATKIIFDKENYTISATFKLVDNDGNTVDYSKMLWDEIEPKIKVALYKKNGSGATGSKNQFYRWANRTTPDSEALENSTNKPKLTLPVELKENIDSNGNFDGTFTVTYKLLNNDGSSTSTNWIQKTWEDGAQWKIMAWTDSNQSSKNYADINDAGTDTISLNDTNQNVPSVTTTIRLIQKDVDGSLPESMFTISDVKLVDDASNDGQLVNKDPDTKISVTRIAGADNNAQHDYYYTVEVAATNIDATDHPYSVLTQAGTSKTINATYMKYDSTLGYTDITTADKVLGSISYNQVSINDEIIPASIRFGMKAQRPENLTSKTQFIGYTSFKFIRKEISSGGATP
ncbi:hypothetical protein [Clostridium sp. AUH-JLR23]|uniref:hypothetical protein n=1 Tax=Clostridium sp. AUH-JLR23 TaxID=1505062 RepID=UPI00356429BD